MSTVDNSYLTYKGDLPALDVGYSDKYIANLLDTGAVLNRAHNVAFSGGEGEKVAASLEKTLPTLHQPGHPLTSKVPVGKVGQRLDAVSSSTAVQGAAPAATHSLAKPGEPTDQQLGVKPQQGLLTRVWNGIQTVSHWVKGLLTRVFGGGTKQSETLAPQPSG